MTITLSPTEVLNLESLLTLAGGLLDELDEAHGRGDDRAEHEYLAAVSAMLAVLPWLPGGSTADLAGIAGMVPSRLVWNHRQSRWVLDLSGEQAARFGTVQP